MVGPCTTILGNKQSVEQLCKFYRYVSPSTKAILAHVWCIFLRYIWKSMQINVCIYHKCLYKQMNSWILQDIILNYPLIYRMILFLSIMNRTKDLSGISVVATSRRTVRLIPLTFGSPRVSGFNTTKHSMVV